MNELKPIVLIDDDVDDIDLLVEAYNTLSHKNRLLIFHDSTQAYEHLVENKIIPLLIISDILMPKMTGPELREKLRACPVFLQHIPFVFFTSAPELCPSVTGDSKIANHCFEKKSDFSAMRTTLESIIDQYSNSVKN